MNIDCESPSKPGTAIAWRKSLPVEEIVVIKSCRCQVALIGNYAIMNIYAPSGSDRKQERHLFFSQDIFNAMSLFPHRSYVLGGDFNSILKPIDVEAGKGFNQKYCVSLKDLVVGCGLVDAFRFEFPQKQEYTFFRPGVAASRLDRFYVPRQLSNSLHVSHLPSLSDHCATLLKIKLGVNFKCSAKLRRTTYWKLNTSILEEEEFVTSFKGLWNEIST